jgi:hypothetical protein
MQSFLFYNPFELLLILKKRRNNELFLSSQLRRLWLEVTSWNISPILFLAYQQCNGTAKYQVQCKYSYYTVILNLKFYTIINSYVWDKIFVKPTPECVRYQFLFIHLVLKLNAFVIIFSGYDCHDYNVTIVIVHYIFYTCLSDHT